MRLINTRTGQFQWVKDTNVAAYSILSHTWSRAGPEQSYQDILQMQREVEQWTRIPHPQAHPVDYHVLKHPALSDKIRCACAIAAEDGYEWLWIDACCIDKLNGPEQTESINSMFNWYRAAQLCYAYLEDVDPGDIIAAPDSQFRHARWHTRGWTLQELIAPRSIVFLASDWSRIGHKAELASILEEVTGVDRDILTYEVPVSAIKIGARMRWAMGRQTERSEDGAYSLMGIFGVYMPVIYGEGFPHAFQRLVDEIQKDFAQSRNHLVVTFNDLDPEVFNKVEETEGAIVRHLRGSRQVNRPNEKPTHGDCAPASGLQEVDGGTGDKKNRTPSHAPLTAEHLNQDPTPQPPTTAMSSVLRFRTTASMNAMMTSTITLSPSVLEHQARLQGELETTELHEHFATVLNDVDPTSEVHSLKERIQDICVAFRELGMSFSLLDNELKRRKSKFLRHLGSKGLRARWNLFEERFKALLDQSQLNAMDASAVLKQNLHIFTDEHVQDSDRVGALKQEIEILITIIGGKIDHAGRLRDNFSRLSKDIRLFGGEIGEKVDCAQQHTAALRNKVLEAHQRLQAFATSVQPFTGERSAWEAANILLRTWQTQESIKQLQKQHAGLTELTEFMQETNNTVMESVLNIDALSNIWRCLRTDMVELRSLLGTVGGGHITELFLHKLTITRTVYRKLVVALEEYSRESL
ncbi:HET-domain-containing protein [Cubamyces sp. BRFM 1775]|nr:HET-domain-containing protein [Cubamyces sp. BRFM 1775]